DLGFPMGTSRRASVRARAIGTVHRPLVDLAFHARDFRMEGVNLAALDVHSYVEPAPHRMHLDDTKVYATAKTGERASVSAKVIELGGRDVRIEDAELHGLGDPVVADVSFRNGRFRASLDAPRIDLPRTLHLAGRDDLAKSLANGTLQLDGAIDDRNIR